MRHDTCSQCGKGFDERACGPTHAVIWAERQPAVIPLGRARAAAVVDAADYDRVAQHRWFLGGTGYAIRNVRPPQTGAIYMPRFILDAPPGSVVDHINHDKLDNRRSNLRIGNKSLNAQNRAHAPKGRSGYSGVMWDKANGRWRAVVKVEGRPHDLGRHASAEAAYEAVRAFRAKHAPWSPEAVGK